MGDEITDVMEEYLECIYRLEQRDGIARTSELAKMLHVALGTITNTIRRLVTNGLVVHEPYKGVQLTNAARKKALDVVRRHRLSERLLTDLLQVTWADSHHAACRLEHALTGDALDNLEKVLDYPTTCPHGNPIPTKNGAVSDDSSDPLPELKIQERGMVSKIAVEESELLEYLDALDLRPGSCIQVVEKAPFNGPITILVDGKLHALGRNIASTIWIHKSSE